MDMGMMAPTRSNDPKRIHVCQPKPIFPLRTPLKMQSIIQEHLEKHASGGKHGSHSIYWVPPGHFKQLPITRWKFNRPPDPERVAEIGAFLKESKRADGLVYLACINHQLVCYEANHRREALQKEMPEGMAHILVDIIWDATDEMVKQEFIRLNKAVSVPDLYVDDSAQESAESVLKAVASFCAKYPKLKSTSGRPNRPNYNGDNFTQDFLRVMKELRISADELLERLERLNTEMAGWDHGKLKLNVILKCQESNLWLFAWSPTLVAAALK